MGDGVNCGVARIIGFPVCRAMPIWTPKAVQPRPMRSHSPTNGIAWPTSEFSPTSGSYRPTGNCNFPRLLVQTTHQRLKLKEAAHESALLETDPRLLQLAGVAKRRPAACKGSWSGGGERCRTCHCGRSGHRLRPLQQHGAARHPRGQVTALPRVTTKGHRGWRLPATPRGNAKAALPAGPARPAAFGFSATVDIGRAPAADFDYKFGGSFEGVAANAIPVQTGAAVVRGDGRIRA